jgi:outer membrane protein OmpA-like peptidoglycan-associated protein
LPLSPTVRPFYIASVMAASRSKLPLLVFFASLALGLAGGSWFFFRTKPVAPVTPSPVSTVPETPQAGPAGEAAPGEAARESRPMTGAASSAPASQGEWLARFSEALETGDFDRLAKLTGDPALAARLREFAGGKPLKLRQPMAREVGELELNALTRWALELEGAASGRERILLDLRRKDGRWSLERLILPASGEAAAPDSLTIADAFLQAVLRQDFETAKSHTDAATVSDATLAGLCILFEEGDYHLRKQKPLRVMLQRPDATGYLANVETSDSSLAAQFSLLLKPAQGGATWRVTEVNLDQLLADFAKRYAGGDTYYTPLIRNPKGGDTLVLYFEFDQDQLAPRTRRQLEIVSRILRGDARKKLTLSGHTDALGATGYNEGLSLRRAEIVRDFLVESGVARDQITTEAKGMSQPRRPNFTETGSDNPEGRRANRRTEIYLDF